MKGFFKAGATHMKGFFKAGATSLSVLIAAATLLWSVIQFNAQQAASAAQTLDQQQQTTLETYLDRMSDLLFTQHLATSKPEDEVRQVARARTLAAVQVLNPVRKGILLRFLYDSNLIGYYDPTARNYIHGPIVSLYGVNLIGADLRAANLYGANLIWAYLSGADLRGAILNGVEVTQEQLDKAKSLQGAILPNGSKHP